ncbi:MAG: ABC-F family ATP-binding cassette domain-containing protein [Lachnospiraceae bacterium]|nr:ABC-F family ATP-binding cassette domain-containing protein [Lachnospiraceae bacterium]
MLLQIRGGAVMYGAETILKPVNFEIRNSRQKIAVVGRNGCGKTTLFKLISGELDLVKRDSDEDVIFAKTGNPTIGYLKQMTFADDTVSMEQEVRKVFAPIISMQREMEDMVTRMESDHSEELVSRYTRLQEQFNYIGGYYYEKEYEVVLKKFGFTDEDKKKPLSEFSGGQRTKIAFVKLLLEKPDILLLDEPTNHLDMETVEWLEGYLKDYPRAVVVISHDRLFLDNIADTVYEIEYGKLTEYPGNYTHFMELKRAAWDKQKKDYEAQQKEIKRLMDWVEQWKNTPTKVASARSKLKAIEHMEKIEKPERYDTRSFKASFTPKRETGKDVLFVKDLEVGYDRVLEKLSLDMKKGERIGIIGENGVGKSTFLKTIVGDIRALGGDYRYGVNVDIGYFDQQMAHYSSSGRVIDDYWDMFPTLTETEVRNDLGAFLFRGEDVFKEISSLSGGERVRLALAKIFKTGPNFLILDEPTNHMDIIGKETLENMLADFEGSLVFVSHDRYFVKRVATRVLEFKKDGVITYNFGYQEYEEKKTANAESAKETKPSSGSVTGTAKPASTESKPEPKYNNPGKEKAKLQKKMEKIEAEIEQAEAELTALKDELSNPAYASSYGKLTEIQSSIDAKETQIMELMEEWGNLDKEVELLMPV